MLPLQDPKLTIQLPGKMPMEFDSPTRHFLAHLHSRTCLMKTASLLILLSISPLWASHSTQPCHTALVPDSVLKVYVWVRGGYEELMVGTLRGISTHMMERR